MIIEEFKNIKSGTRELHQFGVTMGFVLLALGVVVFLRKKYFPVALWGPSMLFFMLGFLAPASLKFLHKIWMSLAIVMGWFMTRLILSVLFFVILTPVSLLARLFGKRFMDTEFKGGAQKSFWIVRAGEKKEQTRYEKQF